MYKPLLVTEPNSDYDVYNPRSHVSSGPDKLATYTHDRYVRIISAESPNLAFLKMSLQIFEPHSWYNAL